MEDGVIKDGQIRTSPGQSGRYNPRLNSVYGFSGHYIWSSFIQVDFGPERKHLTAIAVQGDERGHNTWTFYVKYMNDGSEWFKYTENGVVRVSYSTEILIRMVHSMWYLYTD